MAKAQNIVGIDMNPDRESLGKKFGMTHFLNPKDFPDNQLQEKIIEITDGGADYS